MWKRTVTITLAALLAACGSEGEAPTSDEPVVSETGGIDRSHAGAEMPDVDVVSPDGETVSLRAAAAGEPLLVNLWASWCAPCVEELPTLAKLETLEFAGNPRLMKLNQDMAPAASVEAFLEENGFADMKSWRDPDMAFSDALPVNVMPTTILYDAEGREVWRYLGDRDWADEEAVQLVSEAS